MHLISVLSGSVACYRCYPPYADVRLHIPMTHDFRPRWNPWSTQASTILNLTCTATAAAITEALLRKAGLTAATWCVGLRTAQWAPSSGSMVLTTALGVTTMQPKLQSGRT